MSPYVMPGMPSTIKDTIHKTDVVHSYDLRKKEVVGIRRLRLCVVEDGALIRHLSNEYKVSRSFAAITLRVLDKRYKNKISSNVKAAMNYGLNCQMWVELITVPDKKATNLKNSGNRPPSEYSNSSPMKIANP